MIIGRITTTMSCETDELELDKLGEKKMALFAIIPDNNTDFNFLVSILYTQSIVSFP